MKENFLENVYGYKDIKEELKRIQDWYFNLNKLGDKKVFLPKGIMFYGNPGEGKTFIAREYAKSFNYPIFVIEGDGENILEEVSDIYNKALNEKNAIVVIDEIDKLINKDDKLIRIIMTKLDGFNTNNIITLATCNDIEELSEALLREGRFDRHFNLNLYKNEDVLDVIRGFSRKLKIQLNSEDEEELVELFKFNSPSSIKAVFNNVYLRFGKKPTLDNIIDIFDFLFTGGLSNRNDRVITKSSAIHEAGHAIYIYLFSKTQRLSRIFFNNNGGRTVVTNLGEVESKETRIEYVKISLAGLIAEEIILKYHDVGCSDDLEKAYTHSYRLLNRTCINGTKNFCTLNGYLQRNNNSEYLNKIFDKKASKFMYKNYKIVKKELKKHKREIIAVANYLIKNKGIKRKEFIDIMNEF